MTATAAVTVTTFAVLAFWLLALSIVLSKARAREREVRSCLSDLIMRVSHLDADLDTVEASVEALRNKAGRIPTRTMPVQQGLTTGRHARVD